jgi:hypothetical protein
MFERKYFFFILRANAVECCREIFINSVTEEQ